MPSAKFNNKNCDAGNWGSVNSTVNRLRGKSKNRVPIPWLDKRYFSPKRPHRLRGPHKLLFNGYLERALPGSEEVEA